MAAKQWQKCCQCTTCFNTQPPEGGCEGTYWRINAWYNVSTHSHPKVAAQTKPGEDLYEDVSTHSHPKVAALLNRPHAGGIAFQHTATRRWLPSFTSSRYFSANVSTHSHPKVAAFFHQCRSVTANVSTHSHPKVAAGFFISIITTIKVSTHSHPKVAAIVECDIQDESLVSTHSHPKVAAWRTWQSRFPETGFNTQPPEGGCVRCILECLVAIQFQHTATRRWLRPLWLGYYLQSTVSTHSHPKVAAW